MQRHEKWLLFAYNDLRAAQKLLSSPEDAYICPSMVLAQQSAEKALKGYLFFKAIKPQKTHDLTKLIEDCMLLDGEFEMLISHARDLNPHISISRYPDDRFMIPDLGAAQILVQKSEALYRFVKDKIDNSL